VTLCRDPPQYQTTAMRQSNDQSETLFEPNEGGAGLSQPRTFLPPGTCGLYTAAPSTPNTIIDKTLHCLLFQGVQRFTLQAQEKTHLIAKRSESMVKNKTGKNRDTYIIFST